jgi:hypothetical protein
LDQSRRQLYTQRAEKYLTLFLTHVQSAKEKELAQLAALQQVIDDKLKQLIEDPRTTDIVDELNKTKEELREITSEIDQLLGVKKQNYFDLEPATQIALLEEKENQYNEDLRSSAIKAVAYFDDENFTRERKTWWFKIFEPQPFVAFDKMSKKDWEIVLKLSKIDLDPNTAETFLKSADQETKIRIATAEIKYREACVHVKKIDFQTIEEELVKQSIERTGKYLNDLNAAEFENNVDRNEEKKCPLLDEYNAALVEAKALHNRIRNKDNNSVTLAAQLESNKATLRDLKNKIQLRSFYELLKAKAIEDNRKNDYWLSRLGKSMGIAYTITQIIIMIFLGVLVLSAFGTASWLLGIVIPIMILGVPSTGYSNWVLFRGLTPKTLITLRNMFLIATDVSLTRAQKNKLRLVSFFCIVCGFMASYAFYVLLIEMTPAALSLLNLTGLAVLAAGFPWLVPLILIAVVLPIFIKGAVAVAAYFFRSLYEPTIRGKIRDDIYEFYLAMTDYDEQSIRNKLNTLREDAQKHYGQYYKGQALIDRVNEAVDESTIGIILIKKLERFKNGKSASSIKWHSRLTFFFTCIFMFAMLLGIVVTQFLARANLAQAFSWAYGLANFLSGFICVIAGLTYINVIISGGAKCIVDLAYGVTKTVGPEVTVAEQAKFQGVRAGNSSMNSFEAAAGFILKSAEHIKDFASEAGNIIKSGWDLSVGAFCTISAGAASFLTNSIQGKPTTYEEDWEASEEKYQSTENYHRKLSLESEDIIELKPLLLTCWQIEQKTKKQSSVIIPFLTSELSSCRV